jgi:DNA repair protein RadC
MKKKNYSSYVREIKVTYKTLPDAKFIMTNPEAVFNFLRDYIGYEVREHFVILGINNKNTVMMRSLISIGTVSEAVVHPREVFSPAVMTSCSGIIVCHNHPSGNTEPSRQDLETTKRLIEAGKILGIPVIDHIIITDEAYYSLKENGYIL